MKERPLIEQLGTNGGSAYRNYLRIFVGEESLAALLRYELLTGVLGSMPGAPGYLLRAKLYRFLLGRIGRGTVIGRSVVLRSPGQIALGTNVIVDDGVVLDAKGEGASLELGDGVLVGRNTILSCNEAAIRIGSVVSIGPFCFLAAKGDIEIGSNVSIGSGTHLLAASHSTDDPDTPIIHQTRTFQGIRVGDNVWIGSGVTILDGVTIGRDSILAAGAVVSKDVPEWSVVMGNPARVVQKRK